MQERINKIIQLLIEEVAQLADPMGLNVEKLSQKLLKKGYTEGEIHQAVKWLIMNLNKDMLGTARKPGTRPLPALRVLVAEELTFFTPPAHGYLIQLQTLGLAGALQIEQIIERCFLTGFPHIDIEEVKAIASQVLLGKEPGTFKTDAVYYPGNDNLN